MLQFLVVCGKTSTTKDPTLIVGGSVSKEGQFPWQAAVYSSVDQVVPLWGELTKRKSCLDG
jgi:hypothetical protein